MNTPILFFWANHNTERVEAWAAYCHHPIIYHEINAHHHSMFNNKEHVAEFTGKFKEFSYTPRAVQHEAFFARNKILSKVLTIGHYKCINRW